MGFKFKLGDTVVPASIPEMGPLYAAPAQVIAIQLGGLIKIRFPDKRGRFLVRAEDYKLWREE